MKTKYLIQGAIIAAIYATVTILLAPVSYGVMQVRVAEALTILPMFTPAAVPGLFIGCLVANMLGPNGFLDVLLGSSATLIAAVLSYKLRKAPAFVPLPPVLANALIIGSMLKFVYGVPFSLPICVLWVGLGQGLACYGLGYPLIRLLGKYKNIF